MDYPREFVEIAFIGFIRCLSKLTFHLYFFLIEHAGQEFRRDQYLLELNAIEQK